MLDGGYHLNAGEIAQIFAGQAFPSFSDPEPVFPGALIDERFGKSAKEEKPVKGFPRLRIRRRRVLGERLENRFGRMRFRVKAFSRDLRNGERVQAVLMVAP